MMKNVYVFFADGFEEIEAIAPVDILRRAGCNVTIVSITNDIKVKSSRGITIIADKILDDTGYSNADMLVLPGGMPGTQNLNAHTGLKNSLIEANKNSKFIAAICAAPMVLGHLGILNGKRATCYPGNESDLEGAFFTGNNVEIDSNIITSKGAGTSVQFSLALVEVLFGKEKSKEIADKMMVGV